MPALRDIPRCYAVRGTLVCLVNSIVGGASSTTFCGKKVDSATLDGAYEGNPNRCLKCISIAKSWGFR